MSAIEAKAEGAKTEGAPTDLPARTIVLFALAAFTSSINIRVCDPLLPQMAGAFGTTIGAAAQVVTAFTIGYGLTQLVFGPVGDRLGKYLVVALTTIAAGIATFVAASTTSLESLVVWRFVAGGFAASAIPLAFAWLGDAIPFERRQPVLARFLSAQMSGLVLGQAVGGAIGDLFGWRHVFLIIATLHVIAGALMLAELKLNPGAQPPRAHTRLSLASIAAGIAGILRRRYARTMLIAVFVEAFALYGALAYVGADLHQRLGLTLSMVGLVLAAFGAGAIAYSLTAKAIIPKLGPERMVLVGGTLMAASLLALAAAAHWSVVPPIVMLLGFAFYLMHNTLQTNATQMAPEARGLGVSLFAFALFTGQSLGVAAAAPVMDRYGAKPIYVAAAIVLPLAAVWLRRRLREMK